MTEVQKHSDSQMCNFSTFTIQRKKDEIPKIFVPVTKMRTWNTYQSPEIWNPALRFWYLILACSVFCLLFHSEDSVRMLHRNIGRFYRITLATAVWSVIYVVKNISTKLLTYKISAIEFTLLCSKIRKQQNY
jgi:hypothetical protein